MPKNRLFQLGAAALLLAWAADLLFWAKEPGISFPLFVLLVLGVGLFFAAREGAAPSRASLLLLAPALFFTAMTCLRLEPFTRLLNHALAFGSLALLATTWLGGQWWNYSLVDYLINGLRLGWNALALPAQAWLSR